MRKNIPFEPITDSARAWIQGVIDTCYATFEGLTGKSDGKVYHQYEPGSALELAWASGCKWTAERLMERAMMAHELRSQGPERN